MRGNEYGFGYGTDGVSDGDVRLGGGTVRGMVAIVGRPNVGKSTLFNRLTATDQAIVDDRPGVTRDRLYGTAWIDRDAGSGVTVIDTGGFETDDFMFQPFGENIVWRQTEMAIREANLVLLVVDAKAGVNPHDHQLLRELERQRKPYLVVINKVDGKEQQSSALEFYELGITGEPLSIAAAHNRGIVELRDRIAEMMAEILPAGGGRNVPAEGEAVRIAIIGRPNAGKSSILNRLAGSERTLVSEVAGTTRDTVDTTIHYNGRPYVLIDTAGIRRKSKIDERIESMAVIRSLAAIDRADVVLLVIDAMGGFTEQDARLASHAADRMKPIAIVVNKWDLIPEKTANSARDYAGTIHMLMRTLAFAPVAFVSCLENRRVHSLLGLAERLVHRARRRVTTATLNATLRQVVQEHTPALIKGKTRRIKFFFATQVSVSPPTIVIFCNVASELHESYIRYVHNRFRAMLGFEEIPIRIIFRGKAEIRERDDRDARAAGLSTDGTVAEADGTEAEMAEELQTGSVVTLGDDDDPWASPLPGGLAPADTAGTGQSLD